MASGGGAVTCPPCSAGGAGGGEEGGGGGRGRKSLHAIKLAFSEFYLSLILLQNYQTLNFTGFRKILKKHDKVAT